MSQIGASLCFSVISLSQTGLSLCLRQGYHCVSDRVISVSQTGLSLCLRQGSVSQGYLYVSDRVISVDDASCAE